LPRLSRLELTDVQGAVYVGDDLTDESLFRMARPDWMMVRIGNDMNSAAGYYVQGSNDMSRLLEVLIGRGLAARNF